MSTDLTVTDAMHRALLKSANAYQNADGTVALNSRQWRTHDALVSRGLIAYLDPQDWRPVITIVGWNYLASKGFQRRAEDPGRLSLEQALALAYPRARHTVSVTGNAKVGPRVEVEPGTQVYGDAYVKDRAKILDHAIVRDNAWVSGEAHVTGRARVSGYAHVTGRAHVYGKALVADWAGVYGASRVHGAARVSGSARVSDEAHVHGRAFVDGEARIYGNAHVYGDAHVTGHARVGDDADVYRSDHVIVLPRGFDDPVTVYRTRTGHQVVAGCQTFRLDESADHLEVLAGEHNWPLPDGWRETRETLLKKIAAWHEVDHEVDHEVIHTEGN